MASQDLHSDVKTELAFNIQLVNTTEGWLGNIIDTQNYESIEFIWASGTITDGTYTLTFQHGEASDLSDASTVDSSRIIGSATKTLTAAMDNTTNRYGYVGHKRYVRCNIQPAGVTTGGTMGILMVKSNPRNAPIAEEHV